ncbi:MAG: phosphotransferase enzyme family protein [Bacteroidales bacterium]
MNPLLEIALKFNIEGNIESINPLGSGLINDTYCVKTYSDEHPDYVLQRINHAIFKDVDLLQNNIKVVTEQITNKLKEAGETDIERKSLKIIPATDGKLYYFDGINYWRVTVMIPHSQTFEAINAESSFHTGRAFGKFQSMLVDIPNGTLGETIPNFHNMESRLNDFRIAVKENKANRLESVQWLVDEIEKRAEEMCKAEVLHREGKLPKRITHCDTKVNNLLFDETGDVLCVIDLDTVMPGFVLSDFGDFIRTAGNTGAEDDQNLENVSVNMEIFKAFAKGYIESARSFLLPIEIEMLPYGAKLLTYMQTVRFLTDYLNGDTYYKIKYPEHNHVRSVAQFRLLTSIENKEPEMIRFIKEQL